MQRRTVRFRCVGWSCAVLLTLVAAGVGFGGDPPLGGDAGVSSKPTADDVGFNLALLARSEQEKWNGGAEEATASGIQAGYDNENGFFLSDRDKQGFMLRLSGYMQIRYVLKGRDRRGDTVDPDEVKPSDDSFFDISRARLIFSGFVLNKNLKYKIMIDGNTGKTGARGSGGGIKI